MSTVQTPVQSPSVKPAESEPDLGKLSGIRQYVEYEKFAAMVAKRRQI
jgi:hypothetical protein